MKINKEELTKMLNTIRSEKEKSKVDFERHSGVVLFLEYLLAYGEFEEQKKPFEGKE